MYGTCKHGLRGWSLSCHEALRKHGVKVVVIDPGERIHVLKASASLPNAHRLRQAAHRGSALGVLCGSTMDSEGPQTSRRHSESIARAWLLCCTSVVRTAKITSAPHQAARSNLR